MRERRIVGIDLGTSHTVVAWAPADGSRSPCLFSIPQLGSPRQLESRPLLPSVLYAPRPDEAWSDPWGEAPWAVGRAALERGREVEGRLIRSAKSWLSHPRVDRLAPILPWEPETEGSASEPRPRLSPVDASAAVLRHVRLTWDQSFPEAPLAEQELVLTVPASFDDGARELTLEAARRAGLPELRLLEEPQAAFLAFWADAKERAQLEAEGAQVLICDVGGGTTDLSLLEVGARASAGEGLPELRRLAVGRHLLLGGDNMDLALARLLEPRLQGTAASAPAPTPASSSASSTVPTSVSPPLSPRAFGQLLLACRAAKERLLSEPSLAQARVTLLGESSRLLQGQRSTELRREELERCLVEGFFPRLAPASATEELRGRPRSGLVSLGLPFESDPAITRHLAQFLERHLRPSGARLALLRNGGVFRSELLSRRLLEALEARLGLPILSLQGADPDLAVALGAVHFGLSLHGRGPRIGGGSARGYYLLLPSSPGAPPGSPEAQPSALCVVPRGTAEGLPCPVPGRLFSLTLDEPARFQLLASTERAGDPPGGLLPLDPSFTPLPPLALTLASRGGLPEPESEAPTSPGARKRPLPPRARRIAVTLEGELSPLGTLELRCVEQETSAGPLRKHRLSFQLRESSEAPSGAETASRATATAATARPPTAQPLPAAPSLLSGKRLEEVQALLQAVYGPLPQEPVQVDPRPAKQLTRELERLLGERAQWTSGTARALFDRLIPLHRARKRSAEHERVFLLLAGFTLRPGRGAPGDEARVARLLPALLERPGHPDDPRVWQQLWIAWRRVAAGLEEKTQVELRGRLDPFLAPTEARLQQPKGPRPGAPAELLALTSSLERVPPALKVTLGEWLLERTWSESDPELWRALGRLGARTLPHASDHYVVPASAAERWLEHLLRERWEALPPARAVALALSRKTGDRGRDIGESLRASVLQALEKAGASQGELASVREVVEAEAADQEAFLGESLPLGLALLAPRQTEG